MEILKNVPFSPYLTIKLLCDLQFTLSLFPCGHILTNFAWLRYLAVSFDKLQSQGGPTRSYMWPIGITSNELVQIKKMAATLRFHTLLSCPLALNAKSFYTSNSNLFVRLHRNNI